MECGKKCKDGHKGVSVCGSRFEHADDPLTDPVSYNYLLQLVLWKI